MKRFFASLVFLIFWGCSGSLKLPESGSSARAWSNPRGDCSNWGFAGKLSGEPFEIWRAKIRAPIFAPPVAGDGAIFVGTPIKRVFGFDANTGERIGKLWMDVPVEDGMCYMDSAIFLTGRSIYNRLRAYDLRTRNFIWDKSSDRSASSPIACDDRLFFATAKGVIFAINLRNGEKLWRTALPEAVIEHDPAFRDSLVFISDLNGKLYALSADSGTIRWNVELKSTPVATPVVIPDHVIVPLESGKIMCVQLDGKIRVVIDSPGELISAIACSGPTIFGVTSSGIAFAGDLGFGGILWQTGLSTPVIAPPVLWGLDLVVISAEGIMFILNFADGEILYQIDLKTPVTAGPIIYDNKLYIASEEGFIIAFNKKETEP